MKKCTLCSFVWSFPEAQLFLPLILPVFYPSFFFFFFNYFWIPECTADADAVNRNDTSQHILRLWCYYNLYQWQTDFFDNEKHCCIPRILRICCKTNFCIAFGSASSQFVFSGQLKLARNFLESRNNQANKQLCTHLFDLQQYFECFHLFLCQFLLVN